MKQKTRSAGNSEKSCLKGLGFIASGNGDANTSVVDVKDGRISRIRPLHFDWKYNPKQFNNWKMEARGQTFEPVMKSLVPPYSLAYKNRVYSPNRVPFPIKRVDWDPNGDLNTENRGKSGYVRISWDEAGEIIARELLRVKEKYGTTAILAQSDGHGETKTIHKAHGCSNNLLGLLGGYTLQTRNPDSWEGWYWGAKHVWGCETVGQMEPIINVMPDIAKNTELLLFWGCDPETTPWGFDGQMASRLCYWFTQLGIKCIYICPDLNYGAAVHADKWIPIRPNTDAALQLAIAYTWIEQGTYDKEYVRTHSVGFDKFEAYVMGKEDGIPKTPDWAAEKTGIPAMTIRALASDWASKRTSIAHGNGGPAIRGPYATENGRLEILLLAMQGLGRAGVHQVKMLEWGRRNEKRTNPMPLGKIIPKVASYYADAASYVSNRKPELLYAGFVENNIELPKQIIPKDLIHEALLNPPISWYGTTIARAAAENQFVKYTYPAEGCSEIHMIWTDSPCWITCWNDSNSYIKALRSPKIEFILAQHPWMENDCLFADIVLPVSTKMEQEDINMDLMGGQVNLVFKEHQCIESCGEAKSDYETVCFIAKKLGLYDQYTGGKSEDELIQNRLENSGIKDFISFEEFNEKEYMVIPTDPDWEKYPVGLREFYDNPQKSPLTTPSGKIEFYSERLAKHFPDDLERPPVPKWIEKGISHDERISSKRARKYPLLVISNHPRWRVHANHDDETWLREIPTCKVVGADGYQYEPLWINPDDAKARNINDGDVVKIFNERGAVLAGAYVTDRLMKGAVYIDHGARYDPLVPGELDRGGAINTITPHNVTSKNATGMVCSGFLVEIEKVDLDYLRKKYPEAFARPYHSGAGPKFERVLAKKQKMKRGNH